MESVCFGEKQRYVATYISIFEDLNKSISAVVGVRDSILDLETVKNKDVRGELSCKLNEAHALLDKIEEGIVKGKVEKTFSRYFKVDTRINDSTNRCVKRDKDMVDNLANEIINGKFKVNGLQMPPECRQAIESYINALKDISEKRKGIDAEINGLKDKHLMHYWNEHFRELIILIRREHSELIPEGVKSRLPANIGDLQAKANEIKHYLEIRDRLYDVYNEGYYRYFKESAL
jgi:hypothetical protein